MHQAKDESQKNASEDDVQSLSSIQANLALVPCSRICDGLNLGTSSGGQIPNASLFLVSEKVMGSSKYQDLFHNYAPFKTIVSACSDIHLPIAEFPCCCKIQLWLHSRFMSIPNYITTPPSQVSAHRQNASLFNILRPKTVSGQNSSPVADLQ